LPEDHEGREAYGVRPDPTPDKGRALGRLEEKQGRQIEKGRRGSETDGDNGDGPGVIPIGGG
jgi:hypothetical protein